MKAKRSAVNLIVGLISQGLMLLTAILIPRLVMVNLGSEANGLLNSVNQALVYLGLMEAGVGTVTVQALYAPVASGDRQAICEILKATKRYYRRTGCVYVLAVIAFAVIYPLIVDTELSRSTTVLVILFSGGASTLTYFFHGKYNLYLQAEGKQYVLSGVSTTIHILANLAKVVLLLCGFNVVAVQLAYLVTVVLQAIYMEWYIKRYYGWLKLSAQPNEKAIAQKQSVLVHQICGLIFNNTDTLLLTLVWGLKYVSVYSVYSLVFTQLGNVISTLTSSIMFVLGQQYHKDKTNFYKNNDRFELASFMFTFIFGSVCAILIRPFIRLYTVGVTDVDYLNAWYPPLFLLVFLLTNLRAPAQTVITVAGHFRKTTGRAIIEAAINLTVSLCLLSRFGIIGVLIGTIAALMYRTNDMIIYANRIIMKKGTGKTYRRILINGFVFCVCVIVGNNLHLECYNFMTLVWYGCVISAIVVLIFGCINGVFERELYKQIFGNIIKHVKRKKG